MGIRILFINQGNELEDSLNIATTQFGWINDVTGEAGENTGIEIAAWIKKGVEIYIKTGYDTKKIIVTSELLFDGSFLQSFISKSDKNNLLYLL